MRQTFSPVTILQFPCGNERTLQLCQELKVFQQVKAKALILYLCVPTSKRMKLKTIRKYVFILSSCVLSQSMIFNVWFNILMMRITYRYYTERELSSGWIIYYMIFIYLSKWNIHGHLRLTIDICQFIWFYWRFSSRRTRTSSESCRARWWWGARPSPRPAAAAPWWPPWPRPPRCPRSPRWSRPRPAPRCWGSSGPRRGSGGTKCSPGPEARLCWYTHSCQHQGHFRKLDIEL